MIIDLTLDPPAVKRLGEITAPTLVVSGMLDYDETRQLSKLLFSTINKATFCEIARSAHVPTLEQPEECNRVIREFLKWENT